MTRRRSEVTSEYLFRHSDNEFLHWMVALDGKPLAADRAGRRFLIRMSFRLAIVRSPLIFSA